MSLLQKWLMGLIFLGATSLVVTNPKGFYTATSGLRQLTAGSISDITKGK
jgi:hypothetical protein